MTAYYNEHDPKAAAWLRELIKQGHIAPGVVDERSIEDVTPADLDGFTQCHFFAGIGVWSYALRLAGWPDDEPVWTGSCPCQPFSSAGKGGGFDDERHLWPAWFWLIEQCRPNIVFGEQVASKDGLAWFDLVLADMEGTAYAGGAVDTCAAGFGAPHIRQRLYFIFEKLADAEGGRCRELWTPPQPQGRRYLDGGSLVSGVVNADQCARYRSLPRSSEWQNERSGTVGWLADAASGGRQPQSSNEPPTIRDAGDDPEKFMQQLSPNNSMFDELGDPECAGLEGHAGDGYFEAGWQIAPRSTGEAIEPGADRSAGPVNGYWGDADWLLCRDGKWRAVEPGTFPLAYGAAARVGRLRGYGNGLNAEQATGFIEAFLEVQCERLGLDLV